MKNGVCEESSMTDSTKIIQSVGIDIGTTTTQIVFSLLKVMNRASLTQVAHYEFIDRKIVYASPVYRTPFSSAGIIDEHALLALILKEYDAAGIQPEQVDTGALIITGETWKARNARTTLLRLSEQLGDFVVATAGPHMESIIAGRGSGSDVYSKEHFTRVMNIDIGGGTTNYVVFENGRVIDTACLNVGGRLIETDSSGTIRKIHGPAEKIIEHLSSLVDETSGHHVDLMKFADLSVDLIIECMMGTLSPLARELLMTEPLKTPIRRGDVLFFSGGVGALYYGPANTAGHPFQYEDVGPLLATFLLQKPLLNQFTVLKPKQTIRATVIGAGAYSLSLSGSTIWIDDKLLPLKNIPLVFPKVDWNSPRFDLVGPIREAAKKIDVDVSVDLHGIYLPQEMPLTYEAVRRVSDELARFCTTFLLSDKPVLVLSYNDIGKVLGMFLGPQIQPKPLAVIDEVDLREWDYIDMGKSYFGGSVVPITIKSLVFPR